MSVEGGFSLVKVVDWLWAIVGAAFAIIWKMLTGRMDRLTKQIETLSDEKADKDDMNRQKDNVAKLCDKIEAHARRSDERFNETISLMHTLQREVMDRMDKKQDKRR